MRHRVFVPLQANPMTLREVEAVPVGQGRYRLVGDANSHDRLQFARGEIVECAVQVMPNGANDLVAIRSISADPELRKRRAVYAVSGGTVGALLGGWAGLTAYVTPTAIVVGTLVGAVVFSYSSVRWGDAAWEALRRWL